MEAMQSRMAWVVPLTLLLVIFLLRLGLRGWSQTGLVLTTLPFALIGSVWLLFFQGYNVSTAVWVGLIAVIGTASDPGFHQRPHRNVEGSVRRAAVTQTFGDEIE